MTKLELILSALLACSLLSSSVATAHDPCDRSALGDLLKSMEPQAGPPSSAPQYVPGDGKRIPDQTCQMIRGTIKCY